MHGGFFCFLAATLFQLVTDYDANMQSFHGETRGQARNFPARIQLLLSPRKSCFFTKFVSLIQKETDGRDIWGQRILTLQQGCCRGYSLGDSIHTVDGLKKLWDTIVLVRYQHLNLISAGIMG